MKVKKIENSNNVDIVQCERVRDVRKSLGLHQDEFAALIGVSTNFVSMVENRKRNYSRDKLEIISKKSGYLVEYLLGLTDEKTETERQQRKVSDLMKNMEDENAILEQEKLWAESTILISSFECDLAVSPIMVDSTIARYTFTNPVGESVTISREELFRDFVNEIRDYARYRLGRIVESKQAAKLNAEFHIAMGGVENGKENN